jgi:hypothetical protein
MAINILVAAYIGLSSRKRVNDFATLTGYNEGGSRFK